MWSASANNAIAQASTRHAHHQHHFTPSRHEKERLSSMKITSDI